MGRLQQWMGRLSSSQKRQLKLRKKKIKPRRMLLEVLEEKKLNTVMVGFVLDTPTTDPSDPNITIQPLRAFASNWQSGDPTSVTVNWQITGDLGAGDVIGPTSGSGMISSTGGGIIGNYSYYNNQLTDEDGQYTVEILDGADYDLQPFCHEWTRVFSATAATVSVSDAEVTEGGDLKFKVTLSSYSGSSVTLDYATADGSAGSADYSSASGSLMFTGNGEQEITVSTKADSTVEGSETLTLNLSNLTNATFLDNQGTGTIKDDDHEEPRDPDCDCDCGCESGTASTSTSPTSGTPSVALGNTAGGMEIETASIAPATISTEIALTGTELAADSFEVIPVINGTAGDPIRYSTTGMSAGTYRFNIPVTGATIPEGYSSWELQIRTEVWTDSGPHVRSVSGFQYRRVSDLGLGQGVRPEGFDFLNVQSGWVTLEASNGENYTFPVSGTSYLAPTANHPGYSLTKNGSGNFELTNEAGDSWVFEPRDGLTTPVYYYPKTKTDLAGNVTTYTYVQADGDGKTDDLSLIDEPDKSRSFVYTGGVLASVTSSEFGTTTFQYDAGGRLTTMVQSDGTSTLTTSLTWDSSTKRLTGLWRPDGISTTYAYDAAGRVSSETNAGQLIEQQSKASAGYLDLSTGVGSASDPATLVSASDGQMVTTTEHIGGIAYTTTMTLDRFGNPLTKIDPLGNVWTYTYDSEGRLTSETTPDPDNYAENSFYSGVGPESSLTTTYAYDSDGNLTGKTYPDSSRETWTYDANSHGQPTSYTDRRGGLTVYTFDPVTGKIATERSVVGQIDDAINLETDDVVTSYTYTSGLGQPKGLLETVTDARTHVTSYAYDSEGNATQTTYAVGASEQVTTSAIYDSAGRVSATYDELGRVTKYKYDSLGRLTVLTQPDPDDGGPLTSPVTTYVYDAGGRVTSEIDPLGRITTYTYNAQGQRTAIIKPDHEGDADSDLTITTFTYDETGRVLTETDPLGRVTTYTYSPRQSTVTGPDPDGAGSQSPPIVTTIYDNLGRAAKVTTPLGFNSYTFHNTTGGQVVTRSTDPDGLGSQTPSVSTTVYDANGNAVEEIDALGNTTTTVYDQWNRVVNVIEPDPDGAGLATAPVTTFTYDKVGNRTTEVDALGNTTTYIYDARNRQTSITQPPPTSGAAAPTTTFVYDAAGQKTAEIDARGNTTSYAYDGLGRLTTLTSADPDGSGTTYSSSVTKYSYDDAGRLVTETDARNNTTTYAYDKLDNLWMITRPDPDDSGIATAPIATYLYDAAGQLTQEVDSLGNTTTYQYDGRGRLTTLTQADPDGAATAYTAPVTTYAYDARDRLVSETDPAGHRTIYGYDALDRLTKKTLPNFTTSYVYTYDKLNRLQTETDPLGHTTTYEYDAIGRLTTVTAADPAGAATSPITQYRYDALGRRIAMVDPNLHTTTYVYDNLGRQTGEIDALGNRTTYAYDAVGNRTSLTDSNNNTTTWVYDNVNRVTQEKNARGHSRTFVYDEVGNRTQLINRNNRKITYGYDNLNRQTTEKWIWTDGVTVLRTFTYTYDANDRLTKAQDPEGTYTYVYDNLGRISSDEQSITGLTPKITLARSYGDAGNLTKVESTLTGASAKLDFVTTYNYDVLGRMTRIMQGSQTGGNTVAAKRVQLSYDLDSKLTAISRYSNATASQFVVTSNYTYDELNRLHTLSHVNGATNFAGYTYTYDDGSRITSVESQVDGVTTYSYDDTDQLTGADNASPRTDETYSFDANGNRSTNTVLAANRTTNDGTYTYTYDNENNISSKSNAAGEKVEYSWDLRNRLTKVTFRNASNAIVKTIDYTYDYRNRLVQRVLDADGAGAGASTASYWAYQDGQAVLEFDGSGLDDVSHRYLWGPQVDQILADEQVGDVTTAGNTLWPLTDNLGTVRDLADRIEATGTVSVENHRVIDSYGNITSETNSAVDHLFAFTGRMFDDQSGLQNNLNRWYTPTLGQWMSEDPIGFEGGDKNLRRYVRNSVISNIDPKGLQIISPDGDFDKPWLPTFPLFGDDEVFPRPEWPGGSVLPPWCRPNPKMAWPPTPSLWGYVEIEFELSPSDEEFYRSLSPERRSALDRAIEAALRGAGSPPPVYLPPPSTSNPWDSPPGTADRFDDFVGKMKSEALKQLGDKAKDLWDEIRPTNPVKGCPTVNDPRKAQFRATPYEFGIKPRGFGAKVEEGELKFKAGFQLQWTW
jgi:RHS repeat-associated protein